MKNLFDPATAAEVKERLRSLGPRNARQWGKMTPAQAVEYCALAMEWSVNDTVPPSGTLFQRIMGKMIKPLAVGNDDPMRRNSPTVKSLIVSHHPALDVAKDRLGALIDRFTSGGPTACTAQPHSFFGQMTPDEWAVLSYKHLDHHLRQFGV